MSDSGIDEEKCAHPTCTETENLRRCVHCGGKYCEKHIRAKMIDGPKLVYVDGNLQLNRDGHPCREFTSKFSELAQAPKKGTPQTEAVPLREPSRTGNLLRPTPQKLALLAVLLLLGAFAYLYLGSYLNTALRLLLNPSMLFQHASKPPQETESIRLDAFDKFVLDAVNNERLKHGADELDWNDQLAMIAKDYSYAAVFETASSYGNESFRGFDHVNFSYAIVYLSCTTDSAGAKSCTRMTNLDALSKIPGEWLNDSPIRKSLLSPDFTDAGVGVVTTDRVAYVTIILSNYDTWAALKRIQGPSSSRVLNYTLRGVTSQINITAYYGIKEMLAGISRYLNCNPTCPSQTDVELNFMNQDTERYYLEKLADKIRLKANNSDDQARIAISLVQNIPYDQAGIDSNQLNNRYPYEVIYDDRGICEEKSRLLAYFLRNLGYGVVLFYFKPEDHMTVGVKCPMQYSYMESGYCFIETAGPAIPTDAKGHYTGIGELTSTPQILKISEGNSFDSISEEYNDAQEFSKIREQGRMDDAAYQRLLDITGKYGIPVLKQSV